MLHQSQINERELQRKLVEKIEREVKDLYREYKGAHHVVMIVTFLVIAFAGGILFHYLAGIAGIAGLAAYLAYLMHLKKQITNKQQLLFQEEEKVRVLEGAINRDVERDGTYA